MYTWGVEPKDVVMKLEGSKTFKEMDYGEYPGRGFPLGCSLNTTAVGWGKDDRKVNIYTRIERIGMIFMNM